MSSSYQVFARKYRPRTFDEVLGQDHVVRTLRNAIEQDRIAQAYLFVGPRGTGKTSMARILAKALNCPDGPRPDFDPDAAICLEIAEGRALDVLEIDGASNNGVEQVRELRDKVNFAPATGRYRIFYIDEVHMLSASAFNALLKTLEEPPEHVKFIFATTEPHKVLPTILSRCQRFDLRPIPAKIIANQLLRIAREEGLSLSSEAAEAIARGADGGMRDAESMLDQLVAFCGETIEEEHVVEVFGFTSASTIAELAGQMLRQNTGAALTLGNAQHDAGRDLHNLLGELVIFLRNLLLHQIEPRPEIPDLTPEGKRLLDGCVGLATNDRVVQLVDHLAEAQGRMRWAANKKLHFDTAIIRGVQILQEVSLGDVITYLQQAADGAEPPALSRPAPTPAASGEAPSQKDPQPAPPSESTPGKPPKKAAAKKPGTVADESPAAANEPTDPSSVWQAAYQEWAGQCSTTAATVTADAVPMGIERGRFQIGLPKDEEMFLPELEKEKAGLEQCLARHCGQTVRVEFVFRQDIESRSVEDDPAATQSGQEASDDPPEPVEPVATTPQPFVEEPEEEFYKDPLIQKALDLFQARIVEGDEKT